MKRCANCSRPIRMSNGRWWHSETGLPVGRFADTVSGGAP